MFTELLFWVYNKHNHLVIWAEQVHSLLAFCSQLEPSELEQKLLISLNSSFKDVVSAYIVVDNTLR